MCIVSIVGAYVGDGCGEAANRSRSPEVLHGMGIGNGGFVDSHVEQDGQFSWFCANFHGELKGGWNMTASDSFCGGMGGG